MGDLSERRDGRQREADGSHRQHREHGRRDSASRDRRSSRSPARKRRRSGSPRDHERESKHGHRDGRHSDRHHSHRHREHKTKTKTLPSSIALPFSARQLSKNDLPAFEPLLAEFLFIQKQKDLYEMDEREVKGRWKSFLGKWNRGELAEGWYDPETYQRVKARAEEMGLMRGSGDEIAEGRHGDVSEDEMRQERDEQQQDDDGDDYGPVLPGSGAGRYAGPGMPSRQGLAMRDEQRMEDREASIASLRQARKADRALQRERLDDLTPRAAAGTRERQLEKKQLLNEKLRTFRDRSPGGEVPDAEMMGGAGDELEELKREKEKEQRKKSEREVRREEMDRLRREEMEERRRRLREKEEGTVEVLRELARQRFGG